MFLKRKNKFLFSALLIIFNIVSLDCYALSPDSINVLTWWGYLDSPEINEIVKSECNVTISHDTYYTNDEFLRRMTTNKSSYDIVIFSQTIYNLVKDKIPKNNVDLTDISKKFNPTIKMEYLRQKYPPNIIYFMHSLSGFLWNPKVINITDHDSIQDIFKKAGKNIVVLIDDPVEIWNLINIAYPIKKDSVHLASENFGKLVQDATVYMTNNYNQTYNQNNFAFAFGWSGDAMVYMQQSTQKLNFLIHPKLSYISSDMLAAMNKKNNTICVAKVLLSKRVLDIVQNNTHYFSPYADYKTINQPVNQDIYKIIFKKLPQMKWLESSKSSADFQIMVDTWNSIQMNTRNSKS